jgi:hypothetical protein
MLEITCRLFNPIRTFLKGRILAVTFFDSSRTLLLMEPLPKSAQIWLSILFFSILAGPFSNALLLYWT